MRNDGRVWVPKAEGDERAPDDIPENERDYYLERIYPSFGNLVPRDVASRNAKNVCDEGRGIGPGKRGVYLDFDEAIGRLGEDVIRARYGNLFDMYEMITGENPYKVPMRIYPAPHYTMGGLWVDYYLMSTIPGLFVLGEANFSDHGANRLGASALMQGLADGYFVIPYTLGEYLAGAKLDDVTVDQDACRQTVTDVEERTQQAALESTDRERWTASTASSACSCSIECGMSRTAEGPHRSHREDPQPCGPSSGPTSRSPARATISTRSSRRRAGSPITSSSPSSCAATRSSARSPAAATSARSTRPTRARRFATTRTSANVTVWEYKGAEKKPVAHTEELEFETVQLTQRSYK